MGACSKRAVPSPAGWLEGRLLVGLFEGGVHAPGIRGLELGIQVYLAVGVDETVQPLTGAGVAAHGVDDDRVVALRKILQRQSVAVEPIDGQGGTVEGGGTDLVGDHVQMGGATLRGEIEFGVRGEGALGIGDTVAGHVNRHPVGPCLDDAGAEDGFFASDIGGCHGHLQSSLLFCQAQALYRIMPGVGIVTAWGS